MPHNFDESLEKSQAQADAPWWEHVYRQAFPGFHSMQCIRKDGWAQRGGIDRIVSLKSGRQVTVDEKVREEDWPDILLERWSDRDRKVPGWIQKDLACEYIAYAFIPTRRCYLLPFLNLRKAWITHGRDWCRLAESKSDGFKIVNADNGNYWTESVAVPTEVLLAAINGSMAVEWAAADQIEAAA